MSKIIRPSASPVAAKNVKPAVKISPAPAKGAHAAAKASKGKTGKATALAKKPPAATAAKKTAVAPARAAGKASPKPDGRTETKPAPLSAPAAPAPPPKAEDAPSRLVRQTKTTGSALAHLEKGIGFLYKKDFKKALAELQSLVDNYPNDREIAARARSYLDICKREEARQEDARQEKAADATTFDQLYALGVLEHNRADYDKAVAYFRQSLEKHPKADYIYYSLAASLTRKGVYAEAMENLRRAVGLNEESRVRARHDPDFADLCVHREFLELVGTSRRA